MSDFLQGGGGLAFSAANFETHFLILNTLIPRSVIYHWIAYVVNFRNPSIILIWLPW